MGAPSTIARLALAMYRRLARWYPSTFEAEYRDDITCEAAALLARAYQAGGDGAVLRICPGLFKDLLIGLLAARARDLIEGATDARGMLRLEPLTADLRHAARSLAAARTTTVLAMAVIASSVAVQSLVVAAVDGVLLKPLPYAASDRLVTLHELSTQGLPQPVGMSPANFLDLERRSGAFTAVTASTSSNMIATGPDGPRAIRATRVSPRYFEVFAQPALQGRVLDRTDFEGAIWELNKGFLGATAVAVISRRMADGFFGSAESAVARLINIEGRDWRVVGVMPSVFDEATGQTDVWLPWLIGESYRRELADAPRTWRFLDAAARLKPNASLESARAETLTLAYRLQTEHPVDNQGWIFLVTPTSDVLVQSFRPTLLAVTAGVQLVLLLAAANVASLWLSRNLARAKQFAIRRLLGASRLRIFRQLWLECAMLVFVGAALGLALGACLLPLAVGLLPEGTPRLTNIAIEGRTIGVVAGLALVFATLLSVIASVQLSGGRGTHRLRELPANVIGTSDSTGRLVVVAFQVALALLVLVGGALTLQSLLALRRADLGFLGEHVSVTRVALDRVRYDGARTQAFYARLLDELRGSPRVTAAAAVTALPLSDIGADFTRPYWREGEKPQHAPEARITMVTPGYFETLGVPLLAGRDFEPAEGAASPRVIIVNQTLSERVWPREAAVGQRLIIDYRGGAYAYQVAGVARDTLHDGPRRAAVPEIFVPHAQNPYTLMNVVVKTTLAPPDISSLVASQIARIDPGQAVQSVTTMDQLQARNFANERLASWLLVAMAGLSLIIAAAGLYGVMSTMVEQRRREIALRMALGAPAPAITALFGKSAFRLIAGGCIAGSIGALAAGPRMGPLLFGVSPTDGRTLAGAVVLVVIISAVAALVPLRRAVKVSPAGVLRAY